MDAITHGDVVTMRDGTGQPCYTGRVIGWNSKGALIVHLTASCSAGAKPGDDAMFHPRDWNISKSDSQET